MQLEHQRQQHKGASPDRPSETKHGESSMVDLYGPGKAYPEPYLAGRVPGDKVNERRKLRQEGKRLQVN
jgi:hypothetical protein